MIVVGMNRIRNHREIAVKCGAPQLWILFRLRAAARPATGSRRGDPRHGLRFMMQGKLVIDYLAFHACELHRIPRCHIVVRHLKKQENSSRMHDDGTNQRPAARCRTARAGLPKQVGRIF